MKAILLILTALVLGTAAGRPYKGGWHRKPRCEYVRCRDPCMKVADENGCFKCDCPPICDPPKCDPGCKIQEIFEGPCPGCECIKIEIIDEDIHIDIPACDEPKCPPGCFIERIFDGPCPGCKCLDEEIKDHFIPEIVCDVPKCPKGCSVEKIFDGPCPGCDCKGGDFDIEEDFVPKIICDPPKCLPGCWLQKEFDGPCPGCECEEVKVIEEVKKCPETDPCLSANCMMMMDENGCDICKCKPECAPHCEMVEGKDGCPICICPKKRLFK